MPIIENNTALLVFIRDPKSEAERKVFTQNLGKVANQKIAQTLNNGIIWLCEKTNVRLKIHFSTSTSALLVSFLLDQLPLNFINSSALDGVPWLI